MPLSSQQVLDIICDEEEYVRCTSPSSIPNGTELKFFKIPRFSFTAFRLSHTSPIELSLCSKVVLLGGVPGQWFRERSNRLWNATSYISSRRMQKDANHILNHGYRNFYRKGKEELRRAVSGDTDLSEKDRLKSGPPSVPPSAGLSKEKSRTLAVVPTVDTVEDNKKSPFRAMRHRKTVAVLPPEDSGHDHWSSSEDEYCKRASSVISANEQDLLHATNKELETPRRSYSDGESETRFTTCRTSNHDFEIKEVENAETRSSIQLEATRSDTNPGGSVFDKTSTTDATPTSFVESYALSTSETKKGQNTGAGARIRFADVDQLKSPQVLRRAEQRRIVRLKQTRNSKDAEPLQVMAAQPYEVDNPDKPNYKRHFKTERLAAKRIGHVGTKAQVKVKRGALDIFRGDSLSIGRLFRNLKCGNIVRMEKMLVMVKTAVNQKDPVMCFSQDEPFDTRVSERWKEYIVVARSTGRNDSSLLLQFYHHRRVPKRRSKQKSIAYGSSLDFGLDHVCQVGIYSTLDKTIYIQKPDENYSHYQNEGHVKCDDFDPLKIYILKCGTLLSSGKWYRLLRKATNSSQVFENVKLEVPGADISLDMRFGGDLIKNLVDIEATEKDWLKVSSLNRGYRVLQHPLMRYITIATFEELKKAGFLDLIENWESANVVLGCAYRHYDMLRWCSSNRSDTLMETFCLFPSHLLEYRPYVPSPRNIRADDGSSLTEPVPLEGFLIRLTNKYGLERNRLRAFCFKPSYFFTSENFLFFMSSYKSTPPLPLELTELNMKELVQKKEMLDSLPQVYEQDPYPIDLDSHISWLKDEISQKEFKPLDLYAFNSFNRRVLQTLRAEGLIDLRNIAKIYQGSSDDYKGSEVKYTFLHLGRRTFWRTESGNLQETCASILYLVTTNNLVLKLMAPNPEICHQWKTRLEAHTRYWQLKEAKDTEKIWRLKMQNLQRLNLTEVEESNISEATPRWITNRGMTDATIYNVNTLCELRPLLHKGILYQKPKKHATFSKYVVVLIPGFLLFYDFFHRSTTGFAKEVIDHRHYLTISISDCYIYSGSTTKLDLLTRSGKVEELNAQSRTLPRAYSDGWTSSEDESMRCFTLWFGKKRAMFNRTEKANVKTPNEPRIIDEKENLEKNPNPFQTVSRLGVSGKAMVFMARSRQEKNLWVLSILYELERLRRHDEGLK